MADPLPAPASAPVTFAHMPFWSNPNVQSWLVGLFIVVVGYISSNNPFPAKPTTPAPAVQPAPLQLTPAELQQILDARKAAAK